MYKKSFHGWTKHWDFIIADILFLQISYIIAYMIRLGFRLPYHVQTYQRLAIIMVLVQLVIVFFSGTYSGILRRSAQDELKSSTVFATEVFLGLIIYISATKQTESFSRIVIYSFWIISAMLTWIFRSILKRIVRSRLAKSKDRSRMLIITGDADARRIVKGFNDVLYLDFEIAGIVIIDKDRRGEMIEGVEVVASADDFYEYLKTNVVDEVFINGHTRESADALTDELLGMGITVHYNLISPVAEHRDRIVGNCGEFLVLTTSMHIASTGKLLVKRITDVVGAIVGLVLAGIAVVIFAIPIMVQSKGSVFYSQERIGKNGRRFKIYKLRSMYADADEKKSELMERNEMDGLMFKMEKDPRITPVGRFIRKYSIDELPQFWNVLKGDMSMVGTRPPTPDEYMQYDIHHYARLGYKPGITGLWQVSGRSKITDFEEVVRLDTQYITQWSLWLDIVILFKTILVVVMAKGAE